MNDRADAFRALAEEASKLSLDGPRPFTLAAACNGCGACCDPVTLSFTREGIAEMKPEDFVDPEMRHWALDALTELPREEGVRRAEAHGRNVAGWEHFYECRHYEPETRRCLDWENRPRVCRGFPWYDAPPDPGKRLPRDCSYIEDIPVELRVRR